MFKCWQHAQSYDTKDGRPTSELAAYRIIIRDTKALYGGTPAEEFGPLALKAVRQIWIDRGQARRTVNQYTRRIVHVFRWAVSEEIIPAGLLHAWYVPKITKKAIFGARRVLSLKEFVFPSINEL